MRPIALTFILLTWTVLLSCNSVHNGRSENLTSITDSLTKELDSFSKTTLIPGFAVGLVNDKEQLYGKGFGFAKIEDSIAFTTSTIHSIASVSKTFLALAVMKLVEEGKLSLDEPINAILPYKIINPYYPNIPITVRHLVTHQSTLIDDAFVPYYIGEADISIINDQKKYDSLPAYLQPNLEYYRMGKRISVDQNIRNYAVAGGKWYTDSSFLNKQPGTFFTYSNLGASIAARIVEIRSGMTYEKFTQEFIFDPLRMKATFWNIEEADPSKVSHLYAHNKEKDPTGVVEHPQYYMTNFPVSGLKSSINDLSLYLMEMIKAKHGKGSILKAETYKQLFRAAPDVAGLNKSDSTIFNGSFAKSTFWSITGEGYYEHFGGNVGIYSFLFFDPNSNTGAVGFCNLRDSDFGDLLSIVYKYQKKIAKIHKD